jgi:CHAT domain-containing protein
MNFSHFIFLLVAALFISGAAARPRFETAPGSTRDAIVKGEVKEALSILESKAAEAERQQNWSNAAHDYLEASHAARTAGQLQKGITYSRKALEIAEKNNYSRLQARAIFYLTLDYRSIGQPAIAREWAEKGLELTKGIAAERQNRSFRSLFLRELGLYYTRQREYRTAIRLLTDSLHLLEENLANLKQLNPKRLLKVPNAIPNTQHHILYCLYFLGNAHRQAGNVAEAMKAYEKGIEAVREFRIKSDAEVSLHYGLGRLYAGQKEFPRALENLKKALEMSEGMGLSTYTYSASSQLGDVYLQSQNPTEAIGFYKKAIESIESTRSLLESEEFRSTYFEDKRATYAGLILAYLRTKNAAEAFNYSERARSRAFLDILGSKVQLARGGTLLEHERALQARISVLQAMMVGQEEGASEGPQLRKELAEAQKAYTDFLAEVRKENKEQASLMNVEPLTLKQAQELLDPGVTMLEYFVGRSAVWLWVVEKDRMRVVTIPINRSDLVTRVTWLRETIYQVAEKDKFKGYSQELYKLLIEPALPHIRGKELLIIPHDALHYLPFQALLSQQGRYLIQDYPLYYLSSASLMQFTKEKRRASGQGEKALVMGNPDLGDKAYDLRFAEREAREIARVYPESAVYLRAQATKPKAVELSPKYEILHFAVHGELNENDPLGSALLLAGEGKGDGKLRVGEIFSLNLKADAVVLSACETALGKLSNGDELVGLTRAFIYAGTPSVIATLWKVDDRSSYELMREFYSNLKTMKKAEALRQAQLRTMKEFPQPFFWAAYGLTGEP